MAATPRINIEVEQALLGALLLNNEALSFIGSDICADDFGIDIHGRIFGEAKRQIELGNKVTPVTLKDAFPDVELWPGGLKASVYLARLAAEATTVINAPSYADVVKTLSTMRKLIAVGDDLSYRSWNSGAPDQLLQEAFDEIDRIRLEARNADRAASIGIGGATAVLTEHMAKQYENAGVPQGARAGIVKLDRLLGGFKPGELIVCAGRPGMGKSVLSSSLTRQAAAKGYGVGLFSLEMPLVQTTARLVSDFLYDQHQYIAYNEMLRSESITAEMYNAVCDAQAAIGQLPLIIDDSSSLTVSEIAAKARGMRNALAKRGQKLDLIVLDYLKFIQSSERYRGNRVLEIGEITGSLKRLAKDMGLPILLLCQLNRQVESRDEKRPTLADLRDSGEIEQDADVVFFLYREAYYLQNHPNIGTDNVLVEKLDRCKNVMEIIVAKQRNGPTANISVFADMRCAAVRNLSE